MKGFVIAVLFAATAAVPMQWTNFQVPKSSTPIMEQEEAVSKLISRVIGPLVAEKFVVSIVTSSSSEADWFELSSTGEKISVNANNGVSAASGFYWYLKYFCNASVSWSGDQLRLPIVLPKVSVALRRNAAVPFGYYQNVCTVSYSMAWWDWARWEREIDWMAMNGINLPLAFTGQEYVLQRVYEQFNLTEEDLDPFFSGPGFSAWQRMGNLRGWLGPSVTTKTVWDSFLKAQFDLQLQILNRMRSLGMIPVLPAFAGHVPKTLMKVAPKSNITRSPNWAGFPDAYCCNYLLAPTDPLFAAIGESFVRMQRQLYGDVSNVYNADTFNEMIPDTSDPEYLKQSSAAVYQSMAAENPKAIWLMQGWLFVNDRSFWHQEQIEALLSGVPDDKMIILDLFAENIPVWSQTKSFYGKPFIWCMLHNFGGNIGLYGKIPTIASEPVSAREAGGSTMVGTGLTMEGIDQNYIVYDLMTEMRWNEEAVNVQDWVSRYHSRRYGATSASANRAWDLLSSSVYSANVSWYGVTKSLVVLMPGFQMVREGFMPTKLFYDPADVVAAAKLLLAASKEMIPNEPFKYDLIDVTRQVLSNLILAHYPELMNAYAAKDLVKVQTTGAEILKIIGDIDVLLSTDSHFSLKHWLDTARSWGVDESAKNYFEWNARNQITLWGDSGEINDYASKQWSGLVKGYYLVRWTYFVEGLVSSVAGGVPFDQLGFETRVMDFEQEWQKQFGSIETETAADPLLAVESLLAHYEPSFTRFYSS